MKKDVSELVPRYIVDLDIQHKKLFIKYDDGIVIEVKGIKWTKRTSYQSLLRLGATQGVRLYLQKTGQI